MAPDGGELGIYEPKHPIALQAKGREPVPYKHSRRQQQTTGSDTVLVNSAKRPSHLLVPDYPPDLFAGAARYYAEYRVPYPQTLIDDLRKRTQVTGRGRLLDLGCGTGEVAFAIHTFFSEVWAVDQEPEMVEVGREKAKKRNVTNVVWKAGRAEDVEAPANSFELVTAGAAFHRFDREVDLETCYGMALTWLLLGGARKQQRLDWQGRMAVPCSAGHSQMDR